MIVLCGALQILFTTLLDNLNIILAGVTISPQKQIILSTGMHLCRFQRNKLIHRCNYLFPSWELKIEKASIGLDCK